MAAKKQKSEADKKLEEAKKVINQIAKQVKKEREELEKHPPEALQYVGHAYIEVDALTRELDKYGKHLILNFNDASYETLQRAIDNAGDEINVRAEKELIKIQSKNIEVTVNSIIKFIKDAAERSVVEENKVK
jgi:hypothetical protein